MTEYDVQRNLSEYIRLQYPTAFFRSDMGGVWLPIGLARKIHQLQDGRKWPDVFVAEPRGRYHGLFMELKKDRSEVFTRRGEMRQSEHLLAQCEMLEALNQRGYFACWGLGFDESKSTLDSYMAI